MLEQKYAVDQGKTKPMKWSRFQKIRRKQLKTKHRIFGDYISDKDQVPMVFKSHALRQVPNRHTIKKKSRHSRVNSTKVETKLSPLRAIVPQ